MTFSIITAVFNGEAHIAQCVRSVACQAAAANPDLTVEHLIIDGQSTDATREVFELQLARLESQQATRNYTARWTSEPDNGIYDAMNKGVERATGEIIGILNADDHYAHARVLATVTAALDSSGADSCYGDLVYVRDDNTADTGTTPGTCLPGERVIRHWLAGKMGPRSFHWGWMPPHPTFFVTRAQYQAHGGYRTDLGSAADYELALRMLVARNVSTHYVPEVLVHMRVGGVSNRSVGNRLRANAADRQAWRLNDLVPLPWTRWAKPLRKLPQFLSRFHPPRPQTRRKRHGPVDSR